MKTDAIRSEFGRMPDGAPVDRVVLTHESGIEVAVIGYGAAVQMLSVPDGEGRMGNVVLGHDDLSGYLARRDYFGATVGRYANRIASGSFVLEGTRHDLSQNENATTLHGGCDGFDRRNWILDSFGAAPEPFAVFRLFSPDGDQGFPGALDVRVRYGLTDGRTLSMDFEATTDRPTIVNLTHHGFFNLSGPAAGTILDHRLTIFADRYLPVGNDLIPIGTPLPVAGTPFDFRAPVLVGQNIHRQDEQLDRGRGYDHNYCLDPAGAGAPRLAARLHDPASRRVMELETDQPGLQFYAGGFLDETVLLSGRTAMTRHAALCLEPQCWPDSPNRPDFPSAVLKPGETYRHRMALRFATV